MHTVRILSGLIDLTGSSGLRHKRSLGLQAPRQVCQCGCISAHRPYTRTDKKSENTTKQYSIEYISFDKRSDTIVVLVASRTQPLFLEHVLHPPNMGWRSHALVGWWGGVPAPVEQSPKVAPQVEDSDKSDILS